MMERNVDYNTERTHLVLPEYGRAIQQMVDHALTIEDRSERQCCAQTIVALMKNMQDTHCDQEELTHKLWNHLAVMSSYKLDIDYPVEIECHSADTDKREVIPYPQKKNHKRHYGAIVEELASKLTDIESEDERMELTRLIANCMKRDLANWNRDAMDEEKILEDLANYTDGKVALQIGEVDFISDNDALNSSVPQGGKKKKKKGY